jgi:hypothetical protein
MWTVIARVALAVGLLACLRLALRAIPFVWPSYLLYASVIVALAAGVSLVHPLPLLGMATRSTAAVGLGLSLAAVVVAACWPLTRRRSPSADPLIDRFMPAYDAAESHTIDVPAPPAAVWQAIRALKFDEVPLGGALMRLRLVAFGQASPWRRPRDSRPVLDAILGPGSSFVLLTEVADREIVVGMAGRPWSRCSPVAPADAAAFAAFAESGSVRAAMNLRLVEAPGGTRVSTETRIAGTDAAGTRVFGRYWRVVYPGSALMRQAWLAAIACRVALDAG